VCWRQYAARTDVWNRGFVVMEVGLCRRLETHLTYRLGCFEHFNHPDAALSYLARYIASCVLFCFLSFMMKLFVTRISRS
jgi:hypothetical protein